MSLRSRGPTQVEHSSIAWADTLEALVEVHRLRRAAADTARWPLAHACSHRSPTVEVDGFSDAGAANETSSARHAFCCRSLA